MAVICKAWLPAEPVHQGIEDILAVFLHQVIYVAEDATGRLD